MRQIRAVTVPISRQRRSQPVHQQLQRQHHAFDRSETTNSFANVQNVGGAAGINYPAGASTSPQYWGVPTPVDRGGFTGLQGAPAALRTDTRITTSYVWSHPFAKHQVRIGADYRIDRDTNQLNVNAPGAFTFTGLYSRARDVRAERRRLRRLSARRRRSRPRCRSAAPAAARPIVRHVHRRQLAKELEADVQPRPAVRAGDAVHRRQRTPREPGRRAGISRRSPRSSPARAVRSAARFRPA